MRLQTIPDYSCLDASSHLPIQCRPFSVLKKAISSRLLPTGKYFFLQNITQFTLQQETCILKWQSYTWKYRYFCNIYKTEEKNVLITNISILYNLLFSVVYLCSFQMTFCCFLNSINLFLQFFTYFINMIYSREFSIHQCFVELSSLSIYR